MTTEGTSQDQLGFRLSRTVLCRLGMPQDVNKAVHDTLKGHMKVALPKLQAEWCTRQGHACLRAIVHDLEKTDGAVENLRTIRIRQILQHQLANCHELKWDNLAAHVRYALFLLQHSTRTHVIVLLYI